MKLHKIATFMKSMGKSSKIPFGFAVASLSLFGIYLLSSAILAEESGFSFFKVPVMIHNITYAIWALPAVAGMALSGATISLLLPGIPWFLFFQKTRLCMARLFYQSFIINLIQAGIALTIWRFLFDVAPSREQFVLWQAIVTLIGFFALFNKSRQDSPEIDRFQLRIFWVGVLIILVILPLMMWGKVFIENLTGDGTECFEFARSLKEHYLPYWDLENGYYGFYPSFHLFSFPIFFTMQTLGECEAAARLPVFFYLFGIYLVMAELTRTGREKFPLTQPIILLMACAFFLIYFAYHSTYELFADLAEPTGVDIFFTFIVFSALFSLANSERIWWGILAFLGSTALAAGLPLALLLLFSRYISDRPALKEISMDTIAFAVPWVVYQILVVIYMVYYPMGPPDTIKFGLSGMFARYGFGFNAIATLSLLKKFLLASGFLPAFGLIFLLNKDRIARISGLTVVGYLFVLTAFGRVHSHYLIPIALLPIIVSLRGLQNLTVRFRTFLAFGLAASLIIISVLTFPAGYKPNTTYREFGSHTLMLFDTYPEAVGAAEPFTELFGAGIIYRYRLSSSGMVNTKMPLTEIFGTTAPIPDSGIPWGMGHHTWVLYSDKEANPGKQYLQILAPVKRPFEAPRNYRRLEGENGRALFYDEKRSAFTSLLSIRTFTK
jgi:hypothetical protein